VACCVLRIHAPVRLAAVTYASRILQREPGRV
jgi:hypothetical protein